MRNFIEGIVLIALGAVMLWKPLLFYELKESWKHNGDTEPSEFWIFSTRIGGAAFTLVGIFAVILPFIS